MSRFHPDMLPRVAREGGECATSEKGEPHHEASFEERTRANAGCGARLRPRSRHLPAQNGIRHCKNEGRHVAQLPELVESQVHQKRAKHTPPEGTRGTEARATLKDCSPGRRGGRRSCSADDHNEHTHPEVR
jgi:hypothetical protein